MDQAKTIFGMTREEFIVYFLKLPEEQQAKIEQMVVKFEAQNKR